MSVVEQALVPKPPLHSKPFSFSVCCGISGIVQVAIALLERYGLYYDPGAFPVVLLDSARGFALHTLENKAVVARQCIVVTWSFCPEYWEDLWDYHPYILLVGDGLNVELSMAVMQAHHGRSYRRTPRANSLLAPAERRMLSLCNG